MRLSYIPLPAEMRCPECGIDGHVFIVQGSVGPADSHMGCCACGMVFAFAPRTGVQGGRGHRSDPAYGATPHHGPIEPF